MYILYYQEPSQHILNIIYNSNQFKAKCITIWIHMDLIQSQSYSPMWFEVELQTKTTKGLFSRDVLCHKRPRSESPAKVKQIFINADDIYKTRTFDCAEKATRLGKQRNWIKLIPFLEKWPLVSTCHECRIIPFVETRCCCRGLWPIDGVVHLQAASVRW